MHLCAGRIKADRVEDLTLTELSRLEKFADELLRRSACR